MDFNGKSLGYLVDKEKSLMRKETDENTRTEDIEDTYFHVCGEAFGDGAGEFKLINITKREGVRIPREAEEDEKRFTKDGDEPSWMRDNIHLEDYDTRYRFTSKNSEILKVKFE